MSFDDFVHQLLRFAYQSFEKLIVIIAVGWADAAADDDSKEQSCCCVSPVHHCQRDYERNLFSASYDVTFVQIRLRRTN